VICFDSAALARCELTISEEAVALNNTTVRLISAIAIGIRAHPECGHPYLHMLRFILGLLFLTVGPVCQGAGSGEQIQLIEEGSTNYRIMVGPGASPTEEFAAQELQGYLMQISGVFLPMAPRNAQAEGKLILVGSSAVAKLDLEVDIGACGSMPLLGQDGFVIKTAGDKLVLVGGSPRGTLYSVYTFLEMLGCRWLAPGIIGEVIPQLPTTAIAPIDHLERPSLTYRGFTSFIAANHECAQWIDWMGKNRMNYLMVRLSDYADVKRILGGELERRGMDIGVSFDGFALEDVGAGFKPATTENRLAAGSASAADRMLEFIASNPEVDAIEVCVWPSEAEGCGAQYTEFMTKVAEIIRAQYSGKRISLMVNSGAILDTGSPPPARGSLDARYPASRRCYRHSLGNQQCEINHEVRSHLEGQSKIWGKVNIYEHYMGSYGQNSLPFPILHTIASDIKYFDKLEGVEGVISQCEPGNWGTYGLNYHTFARMAWNADDDLERIMSDYCEKYYGPASSPMKRYFDRLEDTMAGMEHFHYIDPPQLILRLLNEKSLAELEMEIQNAKGLANDAMILDRIRKTQLSLEHAKLLWHTLNHYFKALQLQEAGEHEEARDHFQKAVELGEELVAFLFQNADEGVFIIPENYIFDYLEPLITDARDRKELLRPE
jgi:tetratricopeptide (TPR) repeat protein